MSITEKLVSWNAKQPPSGPGWLHEIKHDGYRAHGAPRRRQHSAPDPQRPRLARPLSFNRGGHGRAIPCRSCLLDGEVVVCRPDGVADFELLRYGEQVKPEAVLFAFDLIELDGMDLRPAPIEDRKAELGMLLASLDAVRLCGHHLAR